MDFEPADPGLIPIVARMSNWWLQEADSAKLLLCMMHQRSSTVRVRALLGVYTFRSSDRPVGPTGRSDDRLV